MARLDGSSSSNGRPLRGTRASALNDSALGASTTASPQQCDRAEREPLAETDSDLSSAPPSPQEPKNVVETPTLKRKRKRGSVATSTDSSTILEDTVATRASLRKQDPHGAKANKTPKRARRQPPKKTRFPNGSIKLEPPENWEDVYNSTQEMRRNVIAPVDTMGCESLAEPTRPPEVQRFQTLVALMLSSQTKDTVTAAAMKRLQEELLGVRPV